MIYAPEMLDILQSAAASAWDATVCSVTCSVLILPSAETRRARDGMNRLLKRYTSCERETALAEAEYYISRQPLPPKAKRILYTVRVSLTNVIDLTAPGLLARLGITDEVLSSSDQRPCRLIGSAVNWLGHDGVLVPSARRVAGTNLVIYQQNPSTDAFEVMSEEVISPDERLFR